MQKTSIKYLVLFLSIAIGQLGASKYPLVLKGPSLEEIMQAAQKAEEIKQAEQEAQRAEAITNAQKGAQKAKELTLAQTKNRVELLEEQIAKRLKEEVKSNQTAEPTFDQVKNSINWASRGVEDALFITSHEPGEKNEDTLNQSIGLLQGYIFNQAIPFIEKRNKGRFSSETLEQSIMTIKLKTQNLFGKTIAPPTFNDQETLVKILNSSIDQLKSQKAKLTKEYFLLPDKRKARDLALIIFNVLINLYTMHRDYIESQQFIL